MKIIFIFVLLHTLVADGSINYCGAKMCAHTNAHTFCRYPAGPSSSCIGYIESELTQEEKARILARLNRRRSEAARGLHSLPPAGDMLKLRWIEELAREAQRWADQCRPPSIPEEHDVCRDLYAISVGQCVASVVGEAPGLRPETMIDIWYMQSKNYRGNVTIYLPPESSSNYYGDFAQIIWSRAYMVGCGRSKFMIQKYGRLRSVERLVCNFAPSGPVPLRSLWNPARPASTCPPRSRPDVDLPALCAFLKIYNKEEVLQKESTSKHISDDEMDESYDEDNVMTLEEHLLLNTIIAIERNTSFDTIGTLDEIYLTKLAVATIDDSAITVSYNSVQKRDLHEKLDTNDKTQTDDPNNITENSLNKRFHERKGKAFIGRPRSYDIDDLNDQSEQENNVKIEKTTTEEKDVYEDYNLPESQYDTTPLITDIVTLPDTDKPSKKFEEKITDSAETFTVNLAETTLNMATEELDIAYINDIVSNLNISQILNETAIDDNVIEDYLTNPETVRQLQESLNRIEYKLAATRPVSGKVRRELRNVQTNHRVAEPFVPRRKSQEVLLAEAERNRSLERGPMLNMVLKYVPYLKQYENSLMGGTGSSRSTSSDNFSVYRFYFLCMLLTCIFK